MRIERISVSQAGFDPIHCPFIVLFLILFPCSFVHCPFPLSIVLPVLCLLFYNAFYCPIVLALFLLYHYPLFYCLTLHCLYSIYTIASSSQLSSWKSSDSSCLISGMYVQPSVSLGSDLWLCIQHLL
jgi:hypothetical protein